MSNKDLEKVKARGGYICLDCAEHMGWRMDPDHRATMHHGQCCRCQERKGLCCYDDFLVPDNRDRVIWD
jgi:hypothetical protein